ncbi:MAG: hypothetical protein ACREDR_38485, partial [Blastocatellia bacterium]
LEEPFFIRNVMGRILMPDPRFAISPVSVLLQAEEVLESLRPNGFVFHMSACGSTLLANMFRALPGTISLGEPNVLYDILALSRTEDADPAVKLFRNCVSALGQKRLGTERHYVIKFGSATTLFLPLILQAFPDVPRIFLYRDPVEVLVSNMKNPGQEWLFEAELTGLDNRTMTEENTVLENCAIALKHTIQAFIDNSEGNHLIVNYNQFSPALIERILSFFGIAASQTELESMLAAGEGHAHNRQAAFQPDAQDKQNAASAKLRRVAVEQLGQVYEQLESMKVTL